MKQRKKVDSQLSDQSQGRFFETIQVILAFLCVFGFFFYVLFFTLDDPRYDLILSQKSNIWEGMVTTFQVSILTLGGSMVLGFVFFLLLRWKQPFFSTLTKLSMEILLGTPLLVMLFLAVYVVGDIFGVKDKFALGVWALIVYMAPYLSNSYATAIAVVDKNQYIVMDLYHFNTFQKYRYVILPQMIGPLIPSLINQFSTIVKGSSLLKIISVSEISYVLTVISTRNWAVIEGYYIMWLCYLCITIPLSCLAKYLGKRYESKVENQ